MSKNGKPPKPPNDGQQSFDFDKPPVIRPTARRSDPDTSWEAANSFTKKRLSAIQQDVLDYFRKVKRATDEQLEDYFREKYQAQTTVSKRRTDLVNLGYLRDSGERAWNRNDRRMIIWELIEADASGGEPVAVPARRGPSPVERKEEAWVMLSRKPS